MTIFSKRKWRRTAWFLIGDDYIGVPIAEDDDEWPIFLSPAPQRVGDEALVKVGNTKIRVRLLPSHGCRDYGQTYLVAMEILKGADERINQR